MNNLMIDLETLSTGNNAVIVQIGACYFNELTGKIGDTFERTIDIDSSLRHGFEVDGETLYWWLLQSKKARESISGGVEKARGSATNVITHFSQFARYAAHVWSHATFDFPLLLNYFKKLNIKPPFSYTTARDIRTVLMLSENYDLRKYQKVGESHTALDDCKFQVKYLVDSLSIIRRKDHEK